MSAPDKIPSPTSPEKWIEEMEEEVNSLTSRPIDQTNQTQPDAPPNDDKPISSSSKLPDKDDNISKE